MEADWEEIGRVVVPPMLPGLPSSPASTVAFDDQQELLWVANDQGRLSAFHGAELQQYSSVVAHIGEGPIRQMLFHEEGVLSLASRSIHLSSRKGRTIWHSHHPSMVDLRCMAFTTTRNRLVIAGCQPTLLVIDIVHGEVVSEQPAQANYTLMKRARHICAATDNGEISILNADSLKVLKTWKGHGGAISDLDARGEFLVTCGHSSRPMGASMMDPLANVYDLKTFNTLPPLPFHAGAAYVCLHPKLQTTSFIASQTGQLQVVDLMNPNSINLRQLSLQYMLGMQLAPAGNALAIIDAEGSVQLWGSRSKIRFSSQRQETEFAHPVSESTPYIDWRDAPLNSISMPYYYDPLLSAWPSHWHFDVGAPPPPIDQQLSLAPSEMGYFAQNPKTTFRYQVEDTRLTVMGTTMAAPKFLSEKAKDTTKNLEGKMSKAAQMLAETTLDSPVAQEGQLAKYSNVEIKYSRFGVDDFDFRYYNKTQFSGLETHIANSFTNALLQLYRFIPLVRNLALHHASTSCKASACLLCEMGFLTDMLEKAAGQNCQATNLLRTFSVLPEAISLGLVEERALTGGVSLSSTIQSINRFMMKQIAQDSKDLAGNSDDVDNIVATNTLESIRCMFCYNEITRPSTCYVLDMVYPQNSPAIDPKILLRNSMYRFSSILKASIERESKSRGWCNKCRRYQQLSLRKSVQSLPLTMMINAALGDSSLHSLWEVPGWLPMEIGILMHANGTFSCFEGKELEFEVRRNTQNMLVYDLVGFVAEIDIPEHQRPHLVSFINVEISNDGQQSEVNWHLFNDFLVSPVTANEALAFKQEFKVPSVLAYQIQSARGAIDHSWKGNLNTSLLFDSYTINGGPITPECKMLQLSEEPMEGTPIALDTEFVDLEKAEIDVKADGTQETIRPAKSGLARVSVLRGAGEDEGTPFIDDYITIPEASIVDYKTQYSGIHPGDLDPRSSPHHLVPLKVAYKKLWLLLNLGCVFVGHGLASDFRKINIQVPKSQTVDTQYLYLEPGKNRRFSLRYLAWAVFKEYIQEESHDEQAVAGHDSIEDARMALRLWRKFQRWQAAGTAEQMVDEIYRKGFRYQWKPPARDGSTTGVNSAAASGRNTPEVAGSSAPTTPARGLRFSAGVPAFAPRSDNRAEGFGSPLR